MQQPTYNEGMKDERKVLYRTVDNNPPDFSELYTKKQQLKNRELALIARQDKADSAAQRRADTRRKIILGGILQKYDTKLRELDPANEKDFAGVAGACAELANDKNFRAWWAQHTKMGQQDNPTGPVES